MLINFSVSNFLSFDSPEVFSMVAGKARKYSDRLYKNKNIKLTKCQIVLGANGSGKSNLVTAFQFFKDVVMGEIPYGFSNKYCRLNEENKNKPSNFEIQILCESHIFTYGFSIVLSAGSIISEYLYEITHTQTRKVLFERDTHKETFIVGAFFKQSDTIAKLNNYGEDSSSEKDILFLNIINRNKEKMFIDYPELQVLHIIYGWFTQKLNVSFPESILTSYPYFTRSNLHEIAELLGALGTGIHDLKIVEVPTEIIKKKIPEEVYAKITSDLEKANIRSGKDDPPKIMLRSYKEFYTFEIDEHNSIRITTIEFCHDFGDTYFDLNEESDGTARILDLIEILFKISDDKIFVVDEIDRCLHPAMTVKIIELFLEMAKRRNTQLVITAHESRLLASDILRNDEISFSIKDYHGSSVIKSLEKYQLRADKKVYAAMFDGTLDVIPQFNDKKLHSIIQ